MAKTQITNVTYSVHQVETLIMLRSIIAIVCLTLFAAVGVTASEEPATTEPLQLKKPVPQIAPIKLGKLSPAFDWISKERVRLMYAYHNQWKETALLDSIVAAGFNSVGYHTAGEYHTESGFLELAKQWLDIQNQRNLRVFVKMPFGSDQRYANNRFGLYQPGGKARWTRTPCPLSKEYWNRVVGDRAVVAAELGLTGLVVDMEMYGADSTQYAGPCYHDGCWNTFVDEYLKDSQARKIPLDDRPTRIAQSNLYKDYSRWQEREVSAILREIEKRVHGVNPDFILGYMLAIEPLAGLARGVGTPDMPCLIFSELEYKGSIGGVAGRVKSLKKLGYPALYVPGFWTRFPPSQYPDLVKQVGPTTGGYWIWNLGAFANWGVEEYDHAKGYSNEDYWKAYRESNDLLTKILASGKYPQVKPATQVPNVTVPRIGHPPRSDKDWQSAAVISSFVKLNTTAPAEVATQVKVLWDGQRLYLRFLCDEPDPQGMPKSSLNRDDVHKVWGCDSIEVFWKRPDIATYAQVLVDHVGTIADQLTEGLGPADPGWNADIQAKPNRTETGWQLDISIPLEADGQGPLPAGSRIRVVFARNRWRDGGLNTTCWPAMLGMFKGSPNLWAVFTLQ